MRTALARAVYSLLFLCVLLAAALSACGPAEPEVDKKQGALGWFDSGPLVIDWCQTHPSDPACRQPMQAPPLRKCNDIYDLTVHQYCQTSAGVIYASIPGSTWPTSARTDPYAYCEHWRYNPDGTGAGSEPVGQSCTMEAISGPYLHVVTCVADCFSAEYAQFAASGYSNFYSPWRNP